MATAPGQFGPFNTGDAWLFTEGMNGGTAGRLFLGANSSTQLTLDTTGNVGIGTTNPTYPLSVNGTIQAKGVIVQTGWSDYVFASSYRLAPLTEVADYIRTNHHLPGIPSAAEVQQEGVSLGDMQSKLLAKVEELTLHMIQADERSNRLEQQNRELQHEIDVLKQNREQRDEQ